MLSDELIIVKGGFSYLDYGRLAGVRQSDKGDLDDKRTLCFCQDKPEVSVLVPSLGNLDRVCVRGEKKMVVLDGCLVQFP